MAKFWLNEGIDGILLDNVAFYVENSAEPTAPVTKEVRFSQLILFNSWVHNGLLNIRHHKFT